MCSRNADLATHSFTNISLLETPSHALLERNCLTLGFFTYSCRFSSLNTNLRDFCQLKVSFRFFAEILTFLSFSRQMHVKIPYINESDMFGSSIVFRWGPKDNLVRHVALFMTGTRLIQRIITSKEQNKTNKKRC